MKKESITLRQAVSLIALFTIGSSLVLGISRGAKQDAWISLIIVFAAMLPVLYIYARLMHRFPGKSLFEICFELFGRVFGRVIIALYVWYALYLGALVLRDFSEFIQITAFPDMPQTVSLLVFVAMIIWSVRKGTEAMGRWAAIALPILLAQVLLTVLLLLKDMKLQNLLPLGENLNAVPRDAFNNFSFPFAETVLFLGVLDTLKQGGKPGRAWIFGILIAWSTLLFGMYFRNALTLGFPLLGDVMFPSYSTVNVIIAGGFVSRIEAIVGANLLIAGFVKIGVCLLVASKGVAALMKADDYRPYAAPLGLLMAALAAIVYSNVREMLDFLPIYSYYAFPFQVILPIVLCIVAEVKFLIREKKEKKQPA